MSNRDRLLLTLFCAIAPFLYSYIMRIWLNSSVLQPIPPFHLVAFTYALAFAVEAIGAALAALVLSVPLACLIHSRPLFLAACLASAAAVSLLPDIFLPSVRSYAAMQVPALLAFFCVSWLAAALVVSRKRRRAA